MKNGLPSYSSIYNLGHKAVELLTDHDLQVEEKIDGSQFSFGIDKDGNMRMRSKNAPIVPGMEGKLFRGAVATVKEIHERLYLRPTWIYRAEVISSPRHNVLTYGRVPKGNLILYDIDVGNQYYLRAADREREAERLGLEVVPILAEFLPVQNEGKVTLESLKKILDNESILGGTKIEGVVLKPVNYNVFGIDKKVLMGKHVSEEFKEVHRKEWNRSDKKDLMTRIANTVSTPARWRKAVQSLREEGLLTHEPRDISGIITRVKEDIWKEEKDLILEMLFNHFKRDIERNCAKSVPGWYKNVLLESQFGGKDEEA